MGMNDTRAAAAENRLRRELAEHFERARTARGLTFRALAREMGSSVSQVQRLLHRELGGSLTLMTIARAAEVLGMKLVLFDDRTGVH